MKIVFLNISDSNGGAATATMRLFENLLKKRVDIKILVRFKRTTNPFVIDVNSVIKASNIIQLSAQSILGKLGFKKSPWNKYPQKKGYLSLLNKSYLKNGLSKLEFDLLHLNWVSEYVNFKEFQKIEKPIIWTLHDCNGFTGVCHILNECNRFKTECRSCPYLGVEGSDLSTKMFYQKMRLYSDLSLYIVTPSKWLAQMASESILFHNKQIYVIPNGIDLQTFFPLKKTIAREVMGFNKSKYYLLFGTFGLISEYNKGFDLLLGAFSNLKKSKLSKEIILVVFGETEKSSIDLVPFQTITLGRIKDDRLLRIIYSSGDLVIVPSRQESFGLIAAEALACETPVIAFATSGLLDIINHQQNGYLANPYDVEDFANGIMWCLEQNTDNILGKNGRIKVEQYFDIDKVADQYLDLYSSVLK